MKLTYILLSFALLNTTLSGMNEQQNQLPIIVQPWVLKDTFDQPDMNVRAVAFNEVGDQLAFSSGDFKSHIFNIADKKEISTFSNNEQITHAICFANHTNHLLATGSDNAQACIINLKTQKNHSFYNKNVIWAAAFNHNNTKLALAANHTARIFDLETNKRISSIQHQDQIFSLAFHPWDGSIITASLNKVRAFDIRTKKKKCPNLVRKNCYIRSIALAPGKNFFGIETPGQTIHIVDYVHDNATIDTGIPVTEDLYSVSFHPETQQLALGLFGKALIYTPQETDTTKK